MRTASHFLVINICMYCSVILGCESTPEDRQTIDIERNHDIEIPDEALSEIDMSVGGPGLEKFKRCEDYPEADQVMEYDAVVPPLGWLEAYRGDGTQGTFSFEDFFCGEEYAESTILIFVIGAGWCQPCSYFARTYLNPRANHLIEDLGAEIVYLQIQDTQGVPANNEFTYRHLREEIGDGKGWRVGDLDTMVRSADEMIPAPYYLSGQADLDIFPAVWVIRKRDMRIIATRELAFATRPGELPFELIAQDPEQDWSAPPPPLFRNLCVEGDEEETEGTTNNVIHDATVITPGQYEGGICDAHPDFYTFEVEGSWRFILEFNTQQGDLDLALWDPQSDRAVLDDVGEAIGSFGTGDVETLSGVGPALLKVYGYNASSARYTVRLEAP